MRLAEHPVLVNAELLPGGELPLARVAGEAGQVVDLVAGLAHPVRRGDHAAALEALGPEQPADGARISTVYVSYTALQFADNSSHLT